jgi:hypothetical protein
MYEKTLATFDTQDKESIKKIDESFENLDQRLTQTDIEYGSLQQTILKLKLARHFQSNESIDLNVLYDALIETPKFIAKDKGSLNRLLEIHQQKTLEKIAEMRKNRAEMTGEEELNPYEALYETDSGDYYMARLLNMPHLQEESEYMKNCVGTSDSYVNKIKQGDVDILSFRHTPTINPDTKVLEGDTPLLTIEYNRTTKVIEQIKKYDNEYLNQDEPYYNDVVDALLKLRNTVDEKGEPRDFKNIKSSEMENIDLQKNHILTSKGEIHIEDYDVNDSEQFILKADTFEITNDTSIELLQKACQIPGMTISCRDIEMAQKVFDGRITSIEGDLDLDSLKSAKGLTLPEHIGGYLNLNGLKSAEGLNLPDHIEVGLYLNGLKSAEGLNLPEHIGGNLYLSTLTTVEGLILPKSIGGSLDLSKLTSAKGLNLPESVGGSLDLSELTSADKQMLREKYPQHIEKIKS